MKQITLKIPAGQSEEINAVGDYVRLKTASVSVRFQVSDADTDATIEQGDALNLKPFERLRISHSDGAEQTITLLIGNGTSSDSAKVGGSVSITGDVSVIDKTYTPVDQYALINVGVVSVVALAARANRRFLMVQNQGVTDLYMNYGLLPAIVGMSLKLGPGQTLLFDAICPNSQISMISSAAGGLAVFQEGV